MVKERKVLEVHITKGMRNGQKIVFHGEADEAPGVVPGDIIFVVEEKVRDGYMYTYVHVQTQYTRFSVRCAATGSTLARDHAPPFCRRCALFFLHCFCWFIVK